jgi:hypothetical protein
MIGLAGASDRLVWPGRRIRFRPKRTLQCLKSAKSCFTPGVHFNEMNNTLERTRSGFQCSVSQLRSPREAFYARWVRVFLLVGVAILYVIFGAKP